MLENPRSSMTGSPRWLVFTLLALASATGGAAAQDEPMTASDRRLAALFAEVGSNPVRVATPTFFVEADGVAAVGTDAVTLAQEGTEVAVDFRDIRNVAMRDSHWLQGMLWGAGAGVLVGGVTGIMLGSFTCRTPTSCSEDERSGMIAWAAALGSAGAIGGFVIGRHSFYWQPIFP
jgi:hypothetical protein